MPAATLLTLLLAQDFTQRGFVENRTLVYPRDAANDSGRVVNETLLRWEASYRPRPWLTFSSSFDARTDSHRQVARSWNVDASGENIARPALSVRRMSATLHRGKFTAELGRQFIRWGKTDILNPTDRFAPKDYLSSVVDTDFLGVSAARVTYETGADTIDVVWQPFFTPSRTPLLNQRWTSLPPLPAPISLYPDHQGKGLRELRGFVGSLWKYPNC